MEMSLNDIIKGFVEATARHCEEIGGPDWRKKGTEIFKLATEDAWKNVFSKGKMNRSIFDTLCAKAKLHLLPGIESGHYRTEPNPDSTGMKIVKEIMKEADDEAQR